MPKDHHLRARHAGIARRVQNSPGLSVPGYAPPGCVRTYGRTGNPDNEFAAAEPEPTQPRQAVEEWTGYTVIWLRTTGKSCERRFELRDHAVVFANNLVYCPFTRFKMFGEESNPLLAVRIWGYIKISKRESAHEAMNWWVHRDYLFFGESVIPKSELEYHRSHANGAPFRLIAPNVRIVRSTLKRARMSLGVTFFEEVDPQLGKWGMITVSISHRALELMIFLKRNQKCRRLVTIEGEAFPLERSPILMGLPS